MTPHDALFKAVFSDPAHARGALQAILPVEVAEAIHWAELAHCPGSFVDPGLRPQHTDLLFSAAWRGGGEALLYLLFEHQSSPDPDMAFRLLRYQVRIWEHWRTEHPGRDLLPAILPIVLYHGATGWSVPLSFDAMIDVPAEIRRAVEPHLVRFSYLLDDLSDIPDEALRRRAMTALGKLTEACFKHARRRTDPVELIRSLAGVVREVAEAAHGLEALVRVMRYILEVYEDVDREGLKAILELVAGPETKDTIMTVGEQLIQEGLQRGHEQGKRDLLMRVLRRRFGDEVDAGIEQRIAAASVDQVEAWADRFVASGAATLGELLTD